MVLLQPFCEPISGKFSIHKVLTTAVNPRADTAAAAVLLCSPVSWQQDLPLQPHYKVLRSFVGRELQQPSCMHQVQLLLPATLLIL